MADVKTRRIGNDAVTAAKLSNALQQGKYVFERFDHQPALYFTDGYGNPAPTTGEKNFAHFRSGLVAQWAVLGAGQTILGPVLSDTTGYLDISQDATATEGVGYVWGCNNPRNPFAQTVANLPTASASSERQSYRIKLRMEDISGIGTLLVGWRKQEAYQADWNDYDELVAWNVTQGVITIEEILNNATTVQRTVNMPSTETSDNIEREFRVDVLGDGKCYFFYQGVQYWGSRFDFDAGEVVVPFLHYLHGTDVSQLFPLELELGPTRELGSRP